MYTRRKLILANALSLANCGRDVRKKLAVIPKANADLFFLTVKAGAEAASHKLRVEIAWSGPVQETDYGRQIEIVDTMIARRVDGLAISATDDRALIGPLERVARAGIPITVFDSAVDIGNYVSLVATDYFGAGCMAPRLLAKPMPIGGPVAMLMQKPGSTSTVPRERGFEETARKEFPKRQIVARQFGMGDRARSMAVAENFLTSHADLAGIFVSSEVSSISSIQAIRARRLSGKVKVIAFDSSDIRVQGLRDGTIGIPPAKRLDIPARPVAKGDLDKPEVKELLNAAVR